MGFKILIPQDVSSVGKNYLLEHGYEIKMGAGIDEKQIIEDVEDCDAILLRTAQITKEILKAGKKLKIIARHGSGYDNIDIKAAAELGIWTTNAPLSTTLSVAEHTIGLMIASARNMVRCDKEFRDGNFEIRNQITGVELSGKTLGLIGVGRIGTLVAKKATLGFDMKVIGYDPYVNMGDVIPEIEIINDWEYIFKNADFISLHMPSTKETQGLVGEKEFNIMKTTAFFINCARGELMNQPDLIQALKKGEIAGAALDVYAKEPPDRDSELYKLRNVILTPHNAAHTVEGKGKMALDAAMEIDRVLSGKKPKWPVNNPKLK